MRNLPQIEPSADFFVRLTEALKQVPPVQRRRRPIFAAAAVTAFAAGLAAALYFVMAFSPEHDLAAPTAPAKATVAQVAPVPMNEVTIAATVPAGVPVWPAMFMVGELPAHFANAELLDPTPGR